MRVRGFLHAEIKADESMVRYRGANIQVGDYNIGSSNNQIEGMPGIMSGLRHVQNVSKRLQWLVQSHSVDIFDLVDVYVEVATDNDKAVVRRKSNKKTAASSS